MEDGGRTNHTVKSTPKQTRITEDALDVGFLGWMGLVGVGMSDCHLPSGR